MNAESVQPALRNFIETFTKIVDLSLLVITRTRFYLLYIVDVPSLTLPLRMSKS